MYDMFMRIVQTTVERRFFKIHTHSSPVRRIFRAPSTAKKEFRERQKKGASGENLAIYDRTFSQVDPKMMRGF